MQSSVSTETRQFTPHQLRTIPTWWPFVETVEQNFIIHRDVIEARQFSPHQSRTTPTRWPFIETALPTVIIYTDDIEARQFSLTHHPRPSPKRVPFVSWPTAAPNVIVHTKEDEFSPNPTATEVPTHDLEGRHPQFSPNQPRTTPTRWPFITIEALSISASITHTLQIVPASPPTDIKAQVHGAPCSSEGQWLCSGSSYQRCACGQWSVLMPLAQGTSCALYGIGGDTSVNGGGGSSGGHDDDI